MQQSDLDGITARGVAARQAGASFHDNPFYFSTVPVNTPEQFDAWAGLCMAWSAGWLKEDAGRDKQLFRMMSMKCW